MRETSQAPEGFESTATRRRNRAGQQGFILALGLLMIVVLALIGTAALSTSTFQKEMSDNVRSNQELYYVSNVALSRSMEQMMAEFPVRYNDALDPGSPVPANYPIPYAYGSFNTISGALTFITPEACPPPAASRTCVCGPSGTASYRNCFDFQVTLYFVNEGNAPPRFGIEQYKSFYWKLSADVTSSSGASNQSSVYTAGIYRVNK